MKRLNKIALTALGFVCVWAILVGILTMGEIVGKLVIDKLCTMDILIAKFILVAFFMLCAGIGILIAILQEKLSKRIQKQNDRKGRRQ